MKILKLIFPVFLCLGLFSCSKKDETSFNGTWELITKPLPEYKYFWKLTDGWAQIYTEEIESKKIDTCTTGEYLVKNGAITIQAPIKYCAWSTYDGEWDVQKSNGEFLILIRYLPRGTIYLEFINRE